MGTNKALAKGRVKAGQFFIVVIGVLLLFTDSRWEENSSAGGGLFLVGAILAGVATVGRMWCSVYISGYKKDSLVTTGPYSMCRNPLYLFSLIGAVGVGLATKTITIPIIVFLLFAVYYPVVIKREEKRLTGIHGRNFEEYRKRVPRFIPSFSSFREPEEYTIKPGFLRKRFTDSLWFVWLIGLIALTEALRRHGVVPVYFRLY